jgi:hypothetical protein
MSLTFSPPFPQVPYMPFADLSGTTTDKTGATTTNMKTLVTAGTNGSKITLIGCKGAGTSVAATLLIFITDTSGTNPKLFDEIVISAVTSSNTIASFRAMNSYSDLELKSGQLIQVGVTALSADIIAWAQQGDF